LLRIASFDAKDLRYWTLLILRECFLCVRRFDEFQSSLGITRHLLAERLKKLVRFSVLRRVHDTQALHLERLLPRRGETSRTRKEPLRS
jgi:DNA-binding HxlR family transcriptional regulator